MDRVGGGTLDPYDLKKRGAPGVSAEIKKKLLLREVSVTVTVISKKSQRTVCIEVLTSSSSTSTSRRPTLEKS